MGVHCSVFHPRISNGDSIAIGVLVCKLSGVQRTVLIDGSALNHAVSRCDRIKDMLPGIGRTHLNEDRFTVGREHVCRLIKPVVCLHGGLFVIENEHCQFISHSIRATNGLHLITTRLPIRDIQCDGCVGTGCPNVFVAVERIADSCIERLTRIVQIIESECQCAVFLYLRRHLAEESRGFAPQRETHFSRSCLAALVGDRG